MATSNGNKMAIKWAIWHHPVNIDTTYMLYIYRHNTNNSPNFKILASNQKQPFLKRDQEVYTDKFDLFLYSIAPGPPSYAVVISSILADLNFTNVMRKGQGHKSNSQRSRS